MKKMLCIALVLLFCVGVVYAQDVEESKLVVGVEWNNGRVNVENLNFINLGVGSFDGALSIKSDDVKLEQYLTSLGYEVSENLIPYLLLGYVRISIDQTLTGSIASPFVGSIDLTKSEMRESAFAYGLGARGELTKIKDISIGYDVRYLMASYDETEEKLDVLGYQLSNSQDLEYTELDLSLIASRKVDIEDNKFLKALTPYVGYKFTKVDLNKRNHISICDISIGTEANLNGITHNGIVGVIAQLTNSFSIAGEVLINDENMGYGVKAVYRF